MQAFKRGLCANVRLPFGDGPLAWAGNVFKCIRVALILRYSLKGIQPFGRHTIPSRSEKRVRIGEKVDLNNGHLVRHGIVMVVRTTRHVCLLPPDLRAI